MGYVYLIQTSPYHFKIGKTKQDRKKRHKQLATGNPNDMPEIYSTESKYYSKLETYLKSKFYKDICVTGESREHFYFDGPHEDLISKVKEEEKRFYEYLAYEEKVEKYKNCDSNKKIRQPTDKMKKLCSELYIIKGKIKNLKFDENNLENQIKAFIEDFEGIEGLATWKTQTQMRLDQESLKQNHIEIYNTYLKENKNRKFNLLAKG